MHNRAQNALSWEFRELLIILLRQFKRLLGEKGIELTDVQIQTIAAEAAAKAPPSEQTLSVQWAMRAIVEESVDVLKQWNLSYEQALKTTMNEIPGWETTADFLELANEKGNAELRISAGASLLAGLGDGVYADYLWHTFQHGASDPEDVDAVIAKRALSFVAGVEEHTPNWEEQIKRWLENRRGYLSPTL